MPIINNQDDWWKAVDDTWDKLLDIMAKVGVPLLLNFGPDGEILSSTLIEELHKAKEERKDYLLRRTFTKTWIMAPDAPYIHQWFGWGTLCDLCSEDWVFADEPPQDTTNNP